MPADSSPWYAEVSYKSNNCCVDVLCFVFWQWVINMEDPDVAGLFAKVEREFGPAAAKDLEETLILIENFNASGRYAIRKMWNFKRNDKATVTETVQLFTDLLKYTTNTDDLGGNKKRRVGQWENGY